MAQKNWQRVSANVDENLKNALNLYCERNKLTTNKFIRQVLERELEPILKPGTLEKRKGVPLVGQNIFEYDLEKDTFDWKLRLTSVNDIAVLCEDVNSEYLEKLQLAIKNALDERSKKRSSMSENSTSIPSKLVKNFEVKK